MRYGLDISMMTHGFSFFENIHEPIYLIHKNGLILKMNKAGRKYLALSKLNNAEIKAIIEKYLSGTCPILDPKKNELKFVRLLIKNTKVFAKFLEDKDYVLIELKK